MKSLDHVAIEIESQEFISGSQDYSVSVKVTNISGVSLSNLQVFNSLSAGRVAGRVDDVDSASLTELEDRKRRIIKELELAVESAYARRRRKNSSFSEILALTIIEAVDVYASLFTRRKSQSLTPVWAEEALKIDEWEDVERLEKEVIAPELDDSFLSKAFSINKEKLKRVLARLDEEKGKEFSKGVSLQPGSTVAYPYLFRSPHLLRQKKFDVTFKASYKVEGEGLVHIRTAGKRILIHPSAFSVPTGGMAGALVGSLIKSTLVSDASLPFNWWGAFGSVALGLVASLLVSRKPDVIKAITVEDFVGGLIIGVISGVYSDKIISGLQRLI